MLIKISSYGLSRRRWKGVQRRVIDVMIYFSFQIHSLAHGTVSQENVSFLQHTNWYETGIKHVPYIVAESSIRFSFRSGFIISFKCSVFFFSLVNSSHTHPHTNAHTQAHSYTHIHIHKHLHTSIHTYVHTHTQQKVKQYRLTPNEYLYYVW